MRLMIASDIHGSKYYCEKMLQAFDREGAEKLLLLGDILYHGPRNDLPREYAPKEVIKMLNDRKDIIMCVRGNCEAEVDQMVLPFSCLSQSGLIFADGKKIFLTHGHIFSMDNHPEGMDVFMQGHTHLPVLEKREDGIIYLNPGSVSIPKGGNPPSYALWRDCEIQLRELYSDRVMASLEM